MKILFVRFDSLLKILNKMQTYRWAATSYTPAVEQGKELPSVVQVVASHSAEAERVEIAEGDGGEYDHWRRHLVQLGDMRVLKVKLHPVHAHHHQNPHGEHEEQNPQGALQAHALISEHVRDAVKGGPGGENFNGSWPLVVHFVRVCFEIHDFCGMTFDLAKKWMDGLHKSANQPYGTVKALLMKRRGSGCKFTPFPHVFVMQSPWDVASLGTNKKIENNSTFIQNLVHVDKSAEAATAQLGSQLHNRDKILKKMSAHGKMPVRSSPADLCKMLELSFGSTLTEVTPGRSAGTGRKQASVKTIGGFGH